VSEAVAIAPAGPGAAATLAALYAATLDDGWTEAAIGRLLASAEGFALTACAQDRALGFALARAHGDDCELLALGVREEARRRGLGARLVAAVCAEARRRGAARVFLEVAEDNAPARALYGRAGFAVLGRRARYYARADGRAAALVLGRALSACAKEASTRPRPAPRDRATTPRGRAR